MFVIGFVGIIASSILVVNGCNRTTTIKSASHGAASASGPDPAAPQGSESPSGQPTVFKPMNGVPQPPGSAAMCSCPCGQNAPMAAPTTPATQTVCDPFGGQAADAAISNGIVGTLKYLRFDQQPFNLYHSDFDKGIPLDARVFLSELNVPTRPFKFGFKTHDGGYLTDAHGEKLIEYFSLDLETEIRLTAQDLPGKYQFAVMSDDGSMLWIRREGKYVPIISNDGYTETRLACANQAIEMNAGTRLPVRLEYFQGPKYHIALVLMWRKVNDTTNLNDVECGQTGNQRFFAENGTDSPPPTQVYIDLLKRGWKPVAPRNFFLQSANSGGGGVNPCRR